MSRALDWIAVALVVLSLLLSAAIIVACKLGWLWVRAWVIGSALH